MTTKPRPHRIDALDVPAETVASDMAQLVARQRLAEGLAAEARHQVDPCDAPFAQLACTHPEKCSTAADYPSWTPGGAA